MLDLYKKMKTFRDGPMYFSPGSTGFSCDPTELFSFGIFSGSHFHVRADDVAARVMQLSRRLQQTRLCHARLARSEGKSRRSSVYF